MKKTSINILCILIIGILSVSVLLPAYYIGAGFTDGVRAGLELSSKNLEIDDFSHPIDVNFESDSEMMIQPRDTITFDDGRSLPVIVRRAYVLIEDSKLPHAPVYIGEIAFLLSLVCLILLIIQFVKFIVNINRGKIFVEDNIKRLRRVSYYLIGISLLNVIVGLSQEYLVHSTGLTLEGYSISAFWALPFSNLLLGLLALLVAQVWSRGIELEEEVKFTV